LNNGLVISITGESIDTGSERGPPLELGPKTENISQLWEMSTPDAAGYSFIHSVLDPQYVIDIRESQPQPGTLQVYRMKTRHTQNQLWRIMLLFTDVEVHAPPLSDWATAGSSGITVVGNPFGLPEYPGGLGSNKSK
jgi:hypothetical protein